MLNIAIIDDENIQRELLSSLITRWADNNGHSISTQLYPSAESFMYTWSEEKSFDILLLDIQLGGEDGVTMAKVLRKSDIHLQIIFVTAYPDFMAEGYEVGAVHYLLKPINEDKLFETLDRAVDRLHRPARTILLPKAGGNVRIPVDDIFYAEAFSHYVTIYMKNGQQDFKMRIADIEKLLSEGFYRCHRSYIVSMKHVHRVTRNAVILDTGKELPLSRAKYDEANQAFIEYN